MALETLVNITYIGGFKVARANKERDAYNPCHESNFIIIDDETNSITFKIQNRPIKEVGVNGCQLDTMIETACLMLTGLNDKFPCRENSIAITKLEEALMWLNQRKLNRERRGVEGLSKA